ncbi:hypothetical protein BJX62DRAFT_211144 [Aspergillus germanicus]
MSISSQGTLLQTPAWPATVEMQQMIGFEIGLLQPLNEQRDEGNVIQYIRYISLHYAYDGIPETNIWPLNELQLCMKQVDSQSDSGGRPFQSVRQYPLSLKVFGRPDSKAPTPDSALIFLFVKHPSEASRCCYEYKHQSSRRRLAGTSCQIGCHVVCLPNDFQ